MPNRITIDLTDAEMAILAHDLLDPEQWIRDAVTGKITACMSRMAQEAQRILMADPAVTTMPTHPEAQIAELIKRPDYKTRKQRDDAERAEIAAAEQAAREAAEARAQQAEAERLAAEAAAAEAERQLQARIDEAIAKALAGRDIKG